MKRKLVGILVVFAVVGVFTMGVAVAHRRAEGYHEESHHGESYHCKDRDCPFCWHKECIAFYLRNSVELGLNEGQIAKLKELERKAKATKIRNMSEVKILKLDIVALLDEKKPSLDDIDAKVDKISALKAEMKKACLHAKVKAKALLSAKQQEKAKELWKSCDFPHYRQRKGEGKEKGKGKWYKFFDED